MKNGGEENLHGQPIHECLINPSWQEMGHARVLVSRAIPNGKIAFAIFLIDLYCLGVKDVFDLTVVRKDVYENMKPMMYFDAEPMNCDVHLAHTIVYGGIDYAHNLGFEPNEDFLNSSVILLPREDITSDSSVVFGKDGRPLYVEGLEDDPKLIIATLNKTVGKGNFDVVRANEFFGDNDEEID